MIVLSRDIPVAARWVVSPIVRWISKNAMLTSLRQMEEAIDTTAGAAEPDREIVYASRRYGNGSRLQTLEEPHFPHSLGAPSLRANQKHLTRSPER